MNAPSPRGAALALVLVSACAVSEPELVRPDRGPTTPSADGKDQANQPERAVIKTALMRLLREDPEKGVGAAEAIATKMGGYSTTSSMEATTLLVPAPKLEEALTALATLGKVDHREIRARDVTEARAD